jgi:ApaG protein
LCGPGAASASRKPCAIHTPLENHGFLEIVDRGTGARPIALPAIRLTAQTFPSMAQTSVEVPGLTARLDRLVHHHGGKCLPEGKPHAFVYFITIKNQSDRTVTLLGRKWMILQADGDRIVIEGDKIVGETPRLAPGEHFSYNSYHLTGCQARAQGVFHGIDEFGANIHVVLDPFDMLIP